MQPSATPRLISVEAAYRVQLDKLIIDLNREYRDNIAPQLKALKSRCATKASA